MNFRSKLAMGFAAILALLLVAAGYASLRNVDNLSTRLRSSYADSVIPLRDADLAHRAFNDLKVRLVIAVLRRGAAREAALTELNRERVKFQRAFAQYQKGATDEPAMQEVLARYGVQQEMNRKLEQALDTVNNNYPKLEANLDKIAALLRAGQQQAAERAYEQTVPLFDSIDAATDTLEWSEVKQGEYLDNESQTVGQRAVRQIPLIAGVAMGMGILLVLVVARSVTEPLLRLTAAAQKVRAGDLDHVVTVESRDEVGQLALAFNTMTESLRTARAELEKRVEARTAELAAANELLNGQMAERERASQALEQAKDAAEAANRAKSDFLAKMSHELRTPLNGVIGAVELILNTNLGSEQRDYLQIARTSADALLQVISDILDFSRAESGKLLFQEVDFNLRHSLEDAFATLSVRALEKGLRMSCHIAPEIPQTVVGDPGRLRQVVLNLVGNAIKFTERGDVKLEVYLQQRTTRDVNLRFAISDTGIGIAPEHRRQIFAPFEQGDGSITRKYGGAGLGLAIAAQLVDIMGGVVWVDSELGKGSTFQFTARFGVADDANPKPRPPRPPDSVLSRPAAPVPVDASPVQVSARLRILVAEDNLINQKIAIRALEKWGHSVAVANNGREALAKLEEQRFDVVLMDLQMPELDGFETTRAIREREKRTARRIPIIAVTAHAMHGDSERCFQAGMDSYVSKPLQLVELFEQIQAVTQLRAPDAVGQPWPPAEPANDPAAVQAAVEPAPVCCAELAALPPDILDAFRCDTPKQLNQLRAALQQQDSATLKRVAHYLKGSAICLGAHRMTQLCRQIETLAWQPTEAESAVVSLESEAVRLCAAVEYRLQTLNCGDTCKPWFAS